MFELPGTKLAPSSIAAATPRAAPRARLVARAPSRRALATTAREARADVDARSIVIARARARASGASTCDGSAERVVREVNTMVKFLLGRAFETSRRGE